VVGHHPLYSSGKRSKSAETLQLRKSLEPIFRQFKVDAYLCGHEHQLEYIAPEGRTHYFISGAGSEVREVKDKISESKFEASDHGFMLLSLTKQKLKMQVINWQGKILYENTITH
jgi:3',5'-cyclic AMP phosphodiesterase CpdA